MKEKFSDDGKEIQYATKREVRSIARDGSGKTIDQARKDVARASLLLHIAEALPEKHTRKDMKALEDRLEDATTYFYHNFLK